MESATKDNLDYSIVLLSLQYFLTHLRFKFWKGIYHLQYILHNYCLKLKCLTLLAIDLS